LDREDLEGDNGGLVLKIEGECRLRWRIFGRRWWKWGCWILGRRF
jgi:hypothetical protein